MKRRGLPDDGWLTFKVTEKKAPILDLLQQSNFWLDFISDVKVATLMDKASDHWLSLFTGSLNELCEFIFYTAHFNNHLINWSSLSFESVLTINHIGGKTLLCIPLRLNAVTAVDQHVGSYLSFMLKKR